MRLAVLSDIHGNADAFAAVMADLAAQSPDVAVKTVFSAELPPPNSMMLTDGTNFKKSAYGTISYLPAAFGGACASVVIRDLVKYVEPKA